MTAPTPVLSIRLPEARVPTFSAFLAEFRQDVGGWSETTGRGLSGVLKKSFFQMFPVPDGESGQSCGVRSWKGTSMVRRLISERSYPWTFPGLARQ